MAVIPVVLRNTQIDKSNASGNAFANRIAQTFSRPFVRDSGETSTRRNQTSGQSLHGLKEQSVLPKRRNQLN